MLVKIECYISCITAGARERGSSTHFLSLISELRFSHEATRGESEDGALVPSSCVGFWARVNEREGRRKTIDHSSTRVWLWSDPPAETLA